MITTSAKHALRIIQVLANHRDRRLPVAEIARMAAVPAPYLAKILGRLRKAGFVEGLKGWNGGFRLTTTGAGRPVLAVLELFGTSASQNECVFGMRRCNPRRPCSLHQDWAQVRSEFRDRLSQVRLSSIGLPGAGCLP